jgi:pimeloyl-ACP methyl ester carboxylesterase
MNPNKGLSQKRLVVRVESDLELTGELMESGDHPVLSAFILQGSGNVDLNGDVSGPFTGQGKLGQSKPELSLQLAQFLSKNGSQSFRFSKRGVENSSKQNEQVPEVLIQDIGRVWETVLPQLKGKKKVLIAVSEGALFSVHAAARGSLPGLDGLFLIGLPTRSVDECLEYQFKHWPLELLSSHADQEGMVAASVLDQLNLGLLPVLSQLAPPEFSDWRSQAHSLGANADIGLHVRNHLAVLYEGVWAQVQGLLQSPQFSEWYRGMKALPAFDEVVKKVKVPVYVYQGGLDAQFRASETRQDVSAFGEALKGYREYSDGGHALVSHDGRLGELKTSGPFPEHFLEQLSLDLKTGL